MRVVRPATERGSADYGWLKTFHTFSFNDYRDPQHVRFRTLRVMNEDFVAPGQGFGTHPHHDMEIVTYILSGSLQHRDSMGTGEVIEAGEFQRMTAGSGVTHSEFNPSPSEPVHLYQIWIFPEQKGLTPSYEQKKFDPKERQGKWQLVASRSGENESLLIHQDAKIWLANLSSGDALDYEIVSGRALWLQVLQGQVRSVSTSASSLSLSAGDGLAVTEEESLQLQADEASQLMLFDLV